MDRRQRKSREAILRAFTELLYRYRPEQVTVSMIIERADVGRATFYAHFSTKEALLEALCADLFCHIFDSTEDKTEEHRHLFSCDVPDSVFEHIFMHIKNNDHQLLRLLTSQGDGLFIKYFRDSLKRFLQKHESIRRQAMERSVPEEYWVSYISNAFISTVLWWADSGLLLSPGEINRYFLQATKLCPM